MSKDGLHLILLPELFRRTSRLSGPNAGSNRGGPRGAVGIISAMPTQEELMHAETFLRSRVVIGAVLNKQCVVEEAHGYNAMVVAEALSIIKILL